MMTQAFCNAIHRTRLLRLRLPKSTASLLATKLFCSLAMISAVFPSN